MLYFPGICVKSINVINLFINSDAIMNCDALWSIRGKNAIYKPLSLGNKQEKCCDI